MGAIQNRVHRETPGAAGGSHRSMRYLIAPAITAAIGLGAHVALADTVTPQNTNDVVASSNVSFVLGGTTVTCTSSSFTVMTPGSSTTPGTPVCMKVTSLPTFGGCKERLSGFNISATITTSGTWNFCLAGNGTAQLIAPGGGITIMASALGVQCKGVSGAATILGTYDNATWTATFTSQTVPFTTSGGFPCPSGNSGSFSGSYITNPHLSVSNP